MGKATIKTNGQRLKLTAVKTLEDDTNITAYSDSVGGSSISLPLLITADYDVYVADGARKLTITQEDGTAFPVQRVNIQPNVTQIIDLRPDLLQELNDLEFLKAHIKWGTGTPEAAVVGIVGDLFLRLDGSTSTTLYVKTSGSSNTGWTAK